MTISNRGERTMLDVLPAQLYAQLHTGDPGEDCTANVATNTTRQAIHFAASYADGSGNSARLSDGTSSANAADPTWTSVPAAEDYRYISLWTHVSNANTDQWSGPITNAPKHVEIGDTFKLTNASVKLSLD